MTRSINDSMIPGNKSLKQWENRYNYVLRKFGVTKKALGVTSHGLRHESANLMYEKITGEKSSVRGGSICIAQKYVDEFSIT